MTLSTRFVRRFTALMALLSAGSTNAVLAQQGPAPWHHPGHEQCALDRLGQRELVPLSEAQIAALEAPPAPAIADAYFDDELVQAATTQEFSEFINADADRVRLGHNLMWANLRPTGFYLPPNASAQIRVTQLQAGTGTPVMLIGTYSRQLWNHEPVHAPLTMNGVTTITADGHGGILYLRYNPASGNPTGRIRVEFLSGQQPMPYFVLGQTTNAQWQTMLNTLTAAPDVQLVSSRAMIVASRANALTHRNENQTALLNLLDRIIQIEQTVSGLDGSAAQHQPARSPQLLTQTQDTNFYMFATHGRTAYQGAEAVSHILSLHGLGVDGWGPWHELGHTHQQWAWTWPAMTEVTVNVYSLAVERGLTMRYSWLSPASWSRVRSYLALPVAQRNYNAETTQLDVRLAMLQQMRLAFGPRFFPALHKRARLEAPPQTMTEAERMRYFMIRSSQVAGRNLGPFFRSWGLPVAQSVYDEITALGLPLPSPNPLNLSSEDVLSHDGFEVW